MQPSSRAIATHKAAGFILETVADIKSESMAGFSSESLAEIARNQHSASENTTSRRSDNGLGGHILAGAIGAPSGHPDGVFWARLSHRCGG